jgi:hypothetical protein
MKKTALVLTLISVLLVSAVAGTQFLITELAQAYPPRELPNPPKVTITSPINQTVYTENDLPLTIAVYVPWMSEYDARVTQIIYRLDYIGPLSINPEVGQETTFTAPFTPPWYDPPPLTKLSYSTLLQDLREGNRNITVSVVIQGEYLAFPLFVDYFLSEGSSTVYFTVDTVPPIISIVSPENRTYDTTDISLNFTVSEPFSWAGYSLNGHENVTIAGNTTLTGLSDSSYNLRVYAKDTAGNMGYSETVCFSISQETEPTPQPEPLEPFSTILFVASIVLVVVIGIGLLLYFKKRKR